MKPDSCLHGLSNSILFLLLSTCLQAQAADLKPYEIKYHSEVKGFDVKTVRKLKRHDDYFELIQTIQVFLVGTKETSTFELTPYDKVIPKTYIYDRNILGHETYSITNFNTALGTATYKEDSNELLEVKLEDDQVYDPINSHIPLRMKLISTNGKTQLKSPVKVLDKDRIREFSYNILGSEWIKTPLGYMDTIKIERERHKKDKHTVIWLAKKWDYIIVKIMHQEADEPAYEMNIINGKIDKKKITGEKSIPKSN